MSQLKNRLSALTMLDRAFNAMSDDDVAAAVSALPDDHREALDDLCGAREGGFTDPAARTLAMRALAGRGRVNGGLEQMSTLLADQCLAKCIELLGDDADMPSYDQFMAVTPTLIDEFGIPVVRLMVATSIAGEANASVMLTEVLKHHETLQLPPVERTELPVLPARTADEETKARRTAAKEKKQAEAAARRAQQQSRRG